MALRAPVTPGALGALWTQWLQEHRRRVGCQRRSRRAWRRCREGRWWQKVPWAQGARWRRVRCRCCGRLRRTGRRGCSGRSGRGRARGAGGVMRTGGTGGVRGPLGRGGTEGSTDATGTVGMWGVGVEKGFGGGQDAGSDRPHRRTGGGVALSVLQALIGHQGRLRHCRCTGCGGGWRRKRVGRRRRQSCGRRQWRQGRQRCRGRRGRIDRGGA